MCQIRQIKIAQNYSLAFIINPSFPGTTHRNASNVSKFRDVILMKLFEKKKVFLSPNSPKRRSKVDMRHIYVLPEILHIMQPKRSEQVCSLTLRVALPEAWPHPPAPWQLFGVVPGRQQSSIASWCTAILHRPMNSPPTCSYTRVPCQKSRNSE